MNMKDKQLPGKVAVVTGAGGGIGKRFAQALGESGASVVMADINEKACKAASEELQSKGLQALAVAVDITSESSVAEMVSAATSRFGGVDIMVNVAALMSELPGTTPMVKWPIDLWEKTLKVNVTGAFLCIRGVVPSMKQRGGGKIINISSGGAYIGGGAYGISKLALIGLTLSLAQELGRFKINVNAIAPGLISTEAGDKSRPPGMTEALTPIIPLKAMGDPEDLLGALIFLASPASDWVTGQTIGVDGGWIKRI
ncbi:MAG: SDR family oxidoreductase [Dehalococcoidia bacterium]